MAKSYTTLKAAIITKLTALLGADSGTLFSAVYGVAETQPAGYPFAYVLERAGKGQILDTARNEREWQFSIVIHQNIVEGITPEQAYVFLLDAVDRVITLFDQDPQLKDSDQEAQCKYVRVLPLEFDYANQETAVHRSLLVVACVDTVNRFA